MFSGSKATILARGYYLSMPVVCVTLSCVCIDMYVGKHPMIILYVSVRFCIYDLYVGWGPMIVQYATIFVIFACV